MLKVLTYTVAVVVGLAVAAGFLIARGVAVVLAVAGGFGLVLEAVASMAPHHTHSRLGVFAACLFVSALLMALTGIMSGPSTAPRR